jgi:hypothetical protein
MDQARLSLDQAPSQLAAALLTTPVVLILFS